MGIPEYIVAALIGLKSIVDIAQANGWEPKRRPGPALYGARSIYLPLVWVGLLYLGGFWS